MQNDTFDIVVVPDFEGRKANIFEVRTLLFLGFWAEYGGKTRNFPLHIACIGKPPASVEQLSAKCGARISLHKPVKFDSLGISNSFANKLRGFEVSGQTDRVLLLDLDVLILSDFSNLSALGTCISAASENVPRISEDYWLRIYQALSIDLPAEKIPTVRWELGLKCFRASENPTNSSQMKAMFPYYNTGVVFAPWNCDLRAKWEENIIKIANLFENEEKAEVNGIKSVRSCDQAGFAISVELLKKEGLRFERLPSIYHSNTNHLYRRNVPLDETKLFHALRMFRQVHHLSGHTEADIKRFYSQYLQLLVKEAWLCDETGSQASTFFRYLSPALKDLKALRKKLLYINQKYVNPYMQSDKL